MKNQDKTFSILKDMLIEAKIIEKHFTLDKNMPDPNHKRSIEPQELRKLVNYTRDFEENIYHV